MSTQEKPLAGTTVPLLPPSAAESLDPLISRSLTWQDAQSVRVLDEQMKSCLHCHGIKAVWCRHMKRDICWLLVQNCNLHTANKVKFLEICSTTHLTNAFESWLIPVFIHCTLSQTGQCWTVSENTLWFMNLFPSHVCTQRLDWEAQLTLHLKRELLFFRCQVAFLILNCAQHLEMVIAHPSFQPPSSNLLFFFKVDQSALFHVTPHWFCQQLSQTLWFTATSSWQIDVANFEIVFLNLIDDNLPHVFSPSSLCLSLGSFQGGCLAGNWISSQAFILRRSALNTPFHTFLLERMD